MEEDCDAILPYLLWPEHFSPDSVLCAVDMAPSMFKFIIPWLETPRAKAALDIASRHRQARANMWKAGGCSGDPDGWRVSFNGWRVSFTRNEERRCELLANYPNKRYYTDAELDALTVKEKVGRPAW